jgi:hypothetical protein
MDLADSGRQAERRCKQGGSSPGGSGRNLAFAGCVSGAAQTGGRVLGATQTGGRVLGATQADGRVLGATQADGRVLGATQADGRVLGATQANGCLSGADTDALVPGLAYPPVGIKAPQKSSALTRLSNPQQISGDSWWCYLQL